MGMYETAKYNVIASYRDKIELREYPTLYMASAKTKVDNRLSSGFNKVFNYISGNNDQQEKISMTTPVVSVVEKGILTTQFMVPSKYGSTPPQPGGDVTIEEISKGQYLVIRFSGSWSEDHFLKMDKVLLNTIDELGFVIDSKRMILRYQPPIVPGFLRRNEIMYKVIRNEE